MSERNGSANGRENKRNSRSHWQQKELNFEAFASAPASHIRSRPTPLRKLKPTIVFDSYWRFAAERPEIFLKRANGKSIPWTDDPILQEYRFTNVYRASERASQYLIRNVIYSGEQSPKEVFFRTLLFKFFNKIDTWELLVRHFGLPNSSDFDVEQYSRMLSREIESGRNRSRAGAKNYAASA